MRSSSHPGRPERKPGRKTDRSQEQNSQRNRGHRQGKLYLIGIGPGNPEHISLRAQQVLESVDTVAGYTTYIELIRPLIQDKNVISTAMMKEVERVRSAIETAISGKDCAIVCSGDPGIYAMAGLTFEMLKEMNIRALAPCDNSADNPVAEALQVEVVPGIPALASGASLLGAPLTHDFAVVSLSDLLTPWEVIAKRLEAAAQADFVIVLYNPKSKRRSEHLKKAQEIVLRYRDQNTVTGIVTAAMRDNQAVSIIPLKDLDTAAVDMQTTVFIGSSSSFRYLDFMVTPRGYADKYRL